MYVEMYHRNERNTIPERATPSRDQWEEMLQSERDRQEMTRQGGTVSPIYCEPLSEGQLSQLREFAETVGHQALALTVEAMSDALKTYYNDFNEPTAVSIAGLGPTM